MIWWIGSASASRTSSDESTIIFGMPATRSRPLISMVLGAPVERAVPIVILMISAVRSPTSRLCLRLT